MKYDIIIIGGGIVGLSTAYKLLDSRPDLTLAILEKENEVASHQTGKNSGVIHSGIYYKPGSLKAKNCINGYQQLIQFCQKEDIPFDICGKVIIATHEAEIPLIKDLYERGLQNGLTKLKMLTAEEIKEYEPHVTGISAIHVPYTGIIDFKEVSEKLAEKIQEQSGGNIFTNHKVIDIRQKSGYAEVVCKQATMTSRLIINTAGLQSDEVASIILKNLDVRIIPFRGEYYEISQEKEYLVKNLIYPVPDPYFPFLGVHFTRMIKGGVEAGPNAVFAFKKEGYKKTDFSWRDFTRSLGWKGYRKVMMKYWKMGLNEYYRSYNKNAFTRALQRLVPEIQKQDLTPCEAGVRAQACGKDGSLIDDFLFAENDFMLNVLNAPSPAATAALSIGETIAQKASERLE